MILSGKTALVAGASRGVGRAIALALAEEGVEILGTSRDPTRAAWPKEIQPLSMDLSSPESAERSWREAGLAETGIDILVNNAGSGVLGAFASTSFADWKSQADLLLLAPMKLSQLAMRGWSEARPGAIVNVTSLAVEYPIPCMVGYNVAKAGLAAFSESLLLEGEQSGARVIELRLGDVNTRFNDSVKRGGGSSRVERVWRAMTRHVDTAPSPEAAARKLALALRKDKVGTIRAGSFFQAVLASLYGKFVSQSMKRASNLSYYNLDD